MPRLSVAGERAVGPATATPIDGGGEHAGDGGEKGPVNDQDDHDDRGDGHPGDGGGGDHEDQDPATHAPSPKPTRVPRYVAPSGGADDSSDNTILFAAIGACAAGALCLAVALGGVYLLRRKRQKEAIQKKRESIRSSVHPRAASREPALCLVGSAFGVVPARASTKRPPPVGVVAARRSRPSCHPRRRAAALAHRDRGSSRARARPAASPPRGRTRRGAAAQPSPQQPPLAAAAAA